MHVVSVETARSEAAAFAGALDALNGSEPASALAQAQSGLLIEPRSARLWHLRALALRDLDRRREAIAAFKRGLEIAPDQPKLVLGLAQTRFEAGLPAVEQFIQAARLQPNDPEILLSFAHALMAEGRADEAIAGMTALLRGSPEWVGGQEFLAHARYTAGERSGFASSFRTALKAHPANIPLRRSAVQLLHSAGFSEDALALLQEGRQLTGEQPVWTLQRAIIAAERGDLNAAEPLFAELADIDDPAVQVRRMRFFIQARMPEPALALFQRYRSHDEVSQFLPYASVARRWRGDSDWARLEEDPRQVGIYDLAAELPPLGDLAAYLRSVHRARSQQLDQSVRGGTQTAGTILSHIDPLIEQTRAATGAAVASYVAELPPFEPDNPLLSARRDRPVRLSGSWSVLLRGRGFHSNHIHPMGWISSALYVDLPEADGECGWLTLGEPQHELNTGLAPFRKVEPKPGRLVLFPSTMWHGTVPFEAGERLTIAFDVRRP